MAYFNEAIPHILESEGGYNHIEGDAGGETNYGISKRAYPDEDIKNLTEDRAKELYKLDYWDKIKADDINSQVIATHIFDAAVNMGVSRAAKMAQSVVNVSADGFIGSQSLRALNQVSPDWFDDKYRLSKIQRYADICNGNRSQRKFLLGWINRALK